MKLTITGPRSVGKTTVSKLVAKKLKLKYISSDEIGENALKKEGGLDRAIKSGSINKFIRDGAYDLIRKIYSDEDNFVFDLSGGSVTSNKFKKSSKKVREVAKDKSIIIGLMPFKNSGKSIRFLLERERERVHFKGMDAVELLNKVEKSFNRFPKIFEKLCDKIIYVEKMSVEEIVEEILQALSSNL